IPLRSPPKQKFLPCPVKSTARTLGAASMANAAARNSRPNSRFMVLAASGRAKLRNATDSRISRWMVGAALLFMAYLDVQAMDTNDIEIRIDNSRKLLFILNYSQG